MNTNAKQIAADLNKTITDAIARLSDREIADRALTLQVAESMPPDPTLRALVASLIYRAFRSEGGSTVTFEAPGVTGRTLSPQDSVAYVATRK